MDANNKTTLNAIQKKLDGKREGGQKKYPSSTSLTGQPIRSNMRDTFSDGRVEVVIPLEVQMSSLRLKHFDEEKNNVGRWLCNDTTDEVHDMALS